MGSNATVFRRPLRSEEKRKEGTDVARAREEERPIPPPPTTLSQGDVSDQPEPLITMKALTTSDAIERASKDDNGTQECTNVSMEEIARELRIVRKQNRVTHWLLSVMIMVTAVWHLSEVSLLIMMKDTLKNPFKAAGSLFTGALWSGPNDSDAGKSTSSSDHNNMEGLPLKPLKMLEFHHVGIPTLNLNSSDDND